VRESCPDDLFVVAFSFVGNVFRSPLSIILKVYREHLYAEEKKHRVRFQSFCSFVLLVSSHRLSSQIFYAPGARKPRPRWQPFFQDKMISDVTDAREQGFLRVCFRCVCHCVFSKSQLFFRFRCTLSLKASTARLLAYKLCTVT
jgi:hypothetical protein